MRTTVRHFSVSVAFLFAASVLGQTAGAASISIIDGRQASATYVSIVGEIQPGDLARVKSLAGIAVRSGTNPLALLLNSPGGDADEAMKIGRWARDMLATTAVYGSNLYTPGTPDGDELAGYARKHAGIRFRAIPVQPNVTPKDSDLVRCYSACVLIFYGGVERFVSDNIDARKGFRNQTLIPVIGLHRPYFSKQAFAALTPAEAKAAYAKLEQQIRAYLREMGAPESVADRMLRKASNEIDLVPDKEFEQFYQRREPFLDEWLIARCEAHGPSEALSDAEQKELARLDSAIRAAINAGQIKSSADLENIVPPGMSLKRRQELEAKEELIGRKVAACRNRAVRQYQLERLGG